jgi:hypothetical protein
MRGTRLVNGRETRADFAAGDTSIVVPSGAGADKGVKPDGCCLTLLASRCQAKVVAHTRAGESSDHLVEPLRPVASVNPAKSTLEISAQRFELCSAVRMGSSLRARPIGRHAGIKGNRYAIASAPARDDLYLPDIRSEWRAASNVRPCRRVFLLKTLLRAHPSSRRSAPARVRRIP